MFPLPCFKVPSHTADPVRVAMFFLSFAVVMQAIVPAMLWQTRLSASLSIIPDMDARNLF
jgi:hypothetical protein